MTPDATGLRRYTYNHRYECMNQDDANGEYVLYTDYASLAQELEKWMQGSARLQEKYDKLIADRA